jgi:hypothetical protein
VLGATLRIAWSGGWLGASSSRSRSASRGRLRSQPGWILHDGLWPLYAWDYNWYVNIARNGYPDGLGGRQYAFFPLWPLALSWVGVHWEPVLAAALAWGASLVAFLGVAAGRTGSPLTSALALACWPGSFALAIAYPDGLALAAAAWAAALALRHRPLLAGAVGAVPRSRVRTAS